MDILLNVDYKDVSIITLVLKKQNSTMIRMNVRNMDNNHRVAMLSKLSLTITGIQV